MGSCASPGPTTSESGWTSSASNAPIMKSTMDRLNTALQSRYPTQPEMAAVVFSEGFLTAIRTAATLPLPPVSPSRLNAAGGRSRSAYLARTSPARMKRSKSPELDVASAAPARMAVAAITQSGRLCRRRPPWLKSRAASEASSIPTGK